MFLIDYVEPEKAEGKIAETYGMFPKRIGVPASLQVFSASPGLLERQSEIIKYFFRHPNMEFQVLAAIRFLGASHFKHEYCVGLNSRILKMAGVKEDELTQLADNPACVFEEKEAALLTFVIKSLKDPSAIGVSEVQEARNAGWTDTDLFDAMAQAAQMSAAGIIYKTFLK